jgi:hypothetical protein
MLFCAKGVVVHISLKGPIEVLTRATVAGFNFELAIRGMEPLSDEATGFSFNLQRTFMFLKVYYIIQCVFLTI